MNKKVNGSDLKSPRVANGAGRQSGRFASSSRSESLTDDDYDFVRNLIYGETRIDLGEHKRELVAARLGKRLRETGTSSLLDYCASLRNDCEQEELYHLIDAISTNHTSFYREIGHFNFLQKTILPEFRRSKPGSSRLFYTWSCACATGEEPYSFAINLADYFSGQRTMDWRMECTDISTQALHFASKAVYTQDHLKNINSASKQRYFEKGKGEKAGYYRVIPKLRKHLHFQRLNLFASHYPWERKFHVILCRNVMIYFDLGAQEELVNRLSRYLTPGGYLLIGHAESLTSVKHPYKMIQPAVYQLPRP